MDKLVEVPQTDLVKHDWYNALVEECGAIITESVWNARNVLIEGRHQLGQRILEDVPNFERQNIYGQKIVQTLAESLSIGSRTIYYALAFVEKHPDLKVFLDTVEEGKNISWNKIIKNYLTEKGEDGKEVIKKFKFVSCPQCRHDFKIEV